MKSGVVVVLRFLTTFALHYPPGRLVYQSVGARGAAAAAAAAAAGASGGVLSRLVPRAPGAVVSSTEIYVGNLSRELSERVLRAVLERPLAEGGASCSPLHVSIPVARRENVAGRQPRGYAFVSFESADEASAAIRAIDGATLLGRTLTAKPRSPTYLSVSLALSKCSSANDVLQIWATAPRDTFDDKNVASAVHKFGTTRLDADARRDPRVGALFATAAGRVRADRYGGEELARLSWGASKVGKCEGARELLRAVAHVAPTRLRSWKSGTLAKLAWSFARSEVGALYVFSAVEREAVARDFADFAPRDFANTLWAFATAGAPAPLLFAAATAKMPALLQDFTPQHMANVAWAYAKVGADDATVGPFLAQLETHAVARLSQFDEQNLASTAWAYATLGVEAPSLFAAIAETAPARVRAGELQSGQTLATLAWACATARHAAPELLEVVAAVATRDAQRFGFKELAMLSSALATAGVKAPAVTAALNAARAAQVSRPTSCGPL